MRHKYKLVFANWIFLLINIVAGERKRWALNHAKHVTCFWVPFPIAADGNEILKSPAFDLHLQTAFETAERASARDDGINAGLNSLIEQFDRAWRTRSTICDVP